MILTILLFCDTIMIQKDYMVHTVSLCGHIMLLRYKAEVSMNQDKGRSGNKMAALATPKKNSYVVKKSFVSQIVNSKTSQDKQNAIRSNAELFRKNNLKTGK